MEWCVHIADPSDLDGELSLDRLASLDGSARLEPALGLARERFAGSRCSRVAFGNEFCERLIPSAQSLRAAREAAAARSLGFTFLTPYAGNDGLAQLRVLFGELQGNGPSEVVFNDWGVLRVLRREFPALTPVQGRLLDKSLRDPRVMSAYADAPADTPAALATLDTLRRSNLDCDSYAALLARFGVSAVELDGLAQGMDLSFVRHGIQVAVWVPFGFVATSRSCMAAGLHYRAGEKFQPGSPCRHECQTHLVEFTYTNSPFANRDQKFLLKGNTYFYAHTARMMDELERHVRTGAVSRLIFEPRLPMTWS